MNRHAPAKKPVEAPETIRTMWAAYYSQAIKRAEFKAAVMEHTGLKDIASSLTVKFLTDNSAGIIYHNEDEPVAFLSVDWADICLRISYVQW